jgi:molybdopterin synthase catalytic subunit
VTVRVRLFAILRERAGSEVQVELPDGATVQEALRALAELPSLAGVLDRIAVRMAVNREYATVDTPLRAGDELALIPPTSGGAHPGPYTERVQGQIRVRVTEEPLRAEELTRAVARPDAGAIVVFCGTPRDVQRLDYEAYSEMAEERMRSILGECMARHALKAAAAEHRVGAVVPGQPSVVVAVSAAHRAEAFAGASEAIDRIKAEAPIWKVEVDRQGRARRVAGEPPPAPAAATAPAAPAPQTVPEERTR